VHARLRNRFASVGAAAQRLVRTRHREPTAAARRLERIHPAMPSAVFVVIFGLIGAVAVQSSSPAQTSGSVRVIYDDAFAVGFSYNQ
jgi:hypothetical protein